MQLCTRCTLSMTISLLTGAFGMPVGLEQFYDLVLLGFDVGSQSVDSNPFVLF